tara:strand:- start:789 stop:977 length:189 start_codon:yes stop_codon:yes gene_type:complete
VSDSESPKILRLLMGVADAVALTTSSSEAAVKEMVCFILFPKKLRPLASGLVIIFIKLPLSA